MTEITDDERKMAAPVLAALRPYGTRPKDVEIAVQARAAVERAAVVLWWRAWIAMVHDVDDRAGEWEDIRFVLLDEIEARLRELDVVE